MNNSKFNSLLERRLRKIKEVLSTKAKEYAIGDRLHNFKRAAEVLCVSPQQALMGMQVKHFVSILDIVNGSIPASEEMIDEKIGDAINYLILLEAVLKEQLSSGT